MYAAHSDKVTDLKSTNFSNAGADSYVRRCLRCKFYIFQAIICITKLQYKLLFAAYYLSPGCTGLIGDACPLCDEFFDFVVKYNKTYKGCEFLRRFEIYKMNKIKIHTLNDKRQDDIDASFDINSFADLTYQEFVKGYTGVLPPQKPPNIRRKRDVPAPPESSKNSVLNVSGSVILQLR